MFARNRLSLRERPPGVGSCGCDRRRASSRMAPQQHAPGANHPRRIEPQRRRILAEQNQVVVVVHEALSVRAQPAGNEKAIGAAEQDRETSHAQEEGLRRERESRQLGGEQRSKLSPRRSAEHRKCAADVQRLVDDAEYSLRRARVALARQEKEIAAASVADAVGHLERDRRRRAAKGGVPEPNAAMPVSRQWKHTMSAYVRIGKPKSARPTTISKGTRAARQRSRQRVDARRKPQERAVDSFKS